MWLVMKQNACYRVEMHLIVSWQKEDNYYANILLEEFWKIAKAATDKMTQKIKELKAKNT